MFQQEYTHLEYFAFAFIVVSGLLLAFTFLRHAKKITAFTARSIWDAFLDAVLWPVDIIWEWFSEDNKSRKKK